MQIQELEKILPLRFREDFEKRQEFLKNVQEIRIRKGKMIYFLEAESEHCWKISQSDGCISEQDMREMIEYISGYSMYAHEEELKQGFLTLKGGHRIGITGETVLENGKIKTIKNLSSFNIRISHSVQGCANRIMKYADKNLLLISPPRMGKTTLLRDILRQLANTPMENVGIVDERSEIASCYRGIPEHDLGERVDILDGCPKAEGMLMLLRSMSPTVIGVDELGKKDDIEALLRVVNCGVRVIATVHGESRDEVESKTVFQELFQQNIFQYYVIIKSKEIQIENQAGACLERYTRIMSGGN